MVVESNQNVVAHYLDSGVRGKVRVKVLVHVQALSLPGGQSQQQIIQFKNYFLRQCCCLQWTLSKRSRPSTVVEVEQFLPSQSI